MDKIDIKILKELLSNSKEQLSKIGKSVRLSRENVHYRIQKLKRQEIIKEFVTQIDYKKLGFSHYVVFVQYTRINDDKEKEIISYLKRHDSISWIGLLTGKWSMTFDVYSKNISELNNIINQFLTTFKENIGKYLVLEILESEYYFNKLIKESPIHKVTKRDIIKPNIG